MNIRFFFPNPGKTKESKQPYAIYLEFRYKGNVYRLNSQIKLKYPHFDPSKKLDLMVTPQYERDTKQSRAAVILEFKRIITGIESVVKKDEAGKLPSGEIKEAFENIIVSKATSQSNIVEYFEKFVNEKVNQRIAANTLKVLNRTKDLLVLTVEQNPKKVYDVFNLTSSFFSDFRNMSQTLGFTVSTYNKYFKWVKAMMDWVIRRNRDAKVNLYFMDEKPIKDITQDVIFIDDIEILQLWEMEFSNKAYEEHRDMFLFQLYSAQRHSEMETLGKSLDSIDEKNKIWYSSSKKTMTVQKIPMTDVMMEMYYKYKDQGSFPVRSNQVRNRMIKKVFEAAGITREITVMKYMLGDVRPRVETICMNKAITTHVARSSMVTMLSLDQMASTIRNITGHTTEKSLAAYQGANIEKIREIMAEKHKFLKSK
jgi:integrase